MTKCVLIVEDNISSADMVKKIITSIDSSVEVLTAGNSELAYKYAMEKDIDVFIIDIILDTTTPGDMSGIRFAKQIRKIPRYFFVPFIFTTSLEDPEIYAYRELHCYGYLEKPFDTGKAEQLIREALTFEKGSKAEENETIYFRKDKIIYPMEINDIVYTQNEKHCMHVYNKNGTELCIPYKTCKQLLDEIHSDCLLQCSRNTLVNRKYIESIDTVNRYITLKDQTKIDIGSTFVKKIGREMR